MTFEEFEKAKPEELKQTAKSCFDMLGASSGSWDRKAVKLIEAQFYLSEIDRRNAEIERQEDRRIASRSHRMELIIIALIIGEIVIGIFGIWLGFREGKEQAVILERIEKAAMRAGNMNLVR